MADDTKFVDGFYCDPPRENAPDFVKARVSIKVEDMLEFLSDWDDGEYLNIDILESRKGNWYGKIDTWKPDSKKAKPRPSTSGREDNFDDDIPF